MIIENKYILYAQVSTKQTKRVVDAMAKPQQPNHTIPPANQSPQPQQKQISKIPIASAPYQHRHQAGSSTNKT